MKACELKPTFDFFIGFIWSSLPRDTIDIKLTVRTTQGIHTFRKDCTVKMATCSPLDWLMKLFLSLQKKIEAYEEEKRDEKSLFNLNPNPFTKRSPSSKRSRENKQNKGKSKVRKLDMSRFAPPKAKVSKLVGPVAFCQSNNDQNYQYHAYNCQPQGEQYYQPNDDIHLQDMQVIGTTMLILCKICSTLLTPGIWLVWWGLGWQQRAREQKKKADSNFTATTNTTTIAHTDVDHLLDTETAPICKLCKTIGDPCPFVLKPDQPPSHLESEDWTKEEKKTRKNEVPNDYHPTSLVYDPTFKQGPLAHYTPKEKLAIDPD